MQNIVRFSLFGNYERYATNNTEIYLKLINFFGPKGYKPATANELQLQPNGQVKVLIMPTFLDDAGAVVEITSNRINFQKVVNEDTILTDLVDSFKNNYSEIMSMFVSEMGITASRLALNVEIEKCASVTEMPLISDYFSDVVKNELSLRNSARVQIGSEMCNVICEKYFDEPNKLTKMVYDINTIAEVQSMRFDVSNIDSIFNLFTQTSIEIEKGLK